MTAFCDLSILFRSMIGLWSFLLCACGLVGIILAFTLNRLRFSLIALTYIVPSYILWQVNFDILLHGHADHTAELTTRLGGLPLGSVDYIDNNSHFFNGV